jgi:hypothetical protein
MKFCPYFVHVTSDLAKIQLRKTHNNLSSDYEFPENRHSEGHALLRGIGITWLITLGEQN